MCRLCPRTPVGDVSGLNTRPGDPVFQSYRVLTSASRRTGSPAFADDDIPSLTLTYAFRVSKNRTASPVEDVTNSPCHITRRPRTKVPTGQPVTRTPSYGVQPAREATHWLVMVSPRLMSNMVKPASYPAAIRPLHAMLNSRAGPALVR